MKENWVRKSTYNKFNYSSFLSVSLLTWQARLFSTFLLFILLVKIGKKSFVGSQSISQTYSSSVKFFQLIHILNFLNREDCGVLTFLGACQCLIHFVGFYKSFTFLKRGVKSKVKVLRSKFETFLILLLDKSFWFSL